MEEEEEEKVVGEYSVGECNCCILLSFS